MEKVINTDLIKVAPEWMRNLILDYCRREGIQDSTALEVREGMCYDFYNEVKDYVLKGGISSRDHPDLSLKECLRGYGVNFDELAYRQPSEHKRRCIESWERNIILNWLNTVHDRHSIEEKFRNAYDELKAAYEREEEEYDEG